jgi:hypothetical protein
LVGLLIAAMLAIKHACADDTHYSSVHSVEGKIASCFLLHKAASFAADLTVISVDRRQ